MERTRPVFNFFADIGDKIVSPRRQSRERKLLHGLEGALADLMERYEPDEIIVLEYTGSTVIKFFQEHPPKATKINLTLYLRDPDAHWDFTSSERAQLRKTEIRVNYLKLTNDLKLSDRLNVTVNYYAGEPILTSVIARVGTHTGSKLVGWLGIYRAVQIGDAKDYDSSNSEMVTLVGDSPATQTFLKTLSDRVRTNNTSSP